MAKLYAVVHTDTTIGWGAKHGDTKGVDHVINKVVPVVAKVGPVTGYAPAVFTARVPAVKLCKNMNEYFPGRYDLLIFPGNGAGEVERIPAGDFVLGNVK